MADLPMIDKRPHFVRPSTIVEVYYDIEYDEHVVVAADGVVTRQRHTREMDEVASAYMAWLHAANNISGPYLLAYERAAERFKADANQARIDLVRHIQHG